MNMFSENVKPRRRGRPAGPTPQGTAARDRLYAIATQLIAARGYEETTLRAIAKEAGVSVGLLRPRCAKVGCRLKIFHQTFGRDHGKDHEKDRENGSMDHLPSDGHEAKKRTCPVRHPRC